MRYSLKELMMKAAIVGEAGKRPEYGDFKEPVAEEGEFSVSVSVAALSPLAKSRASGTHYSSSGLFPFIAGVDGVGRLENGRRVYFLLPKAPFGSMAEQVVIRPAQCIFLPDDLDDATAAAIANPGMSSWAALKERAKFKAGETVLINGATGTSGRLAVQIAKHMGAARVIATGRNTAALDEISALGADDLLQIGDDRDANETSFLTQFSRGVDVVLDYLWGPSAERFLSRLASGLRRKQFRCRIWKMPGHRPILLPARFSKSEDVVEPANPGARLSAACRRPF